MTSRIIALFASAVISVAAHADFSLSGHVWGGGFPGPSEESFSPINSQGGTGGGTTAGGFGRASVTVETAQSATASTIRLRGSAGHPDASVGHTSAYTRDPSTFDPQGLLLTLTSAANFSMANSSTATTFESAGSSETFGITPVRLTAVSGVITSTDGLTGSLSEGTYRLEIVVAAFARGNAEYLPSWAGYQDVVDTELGAASAKLDWTLSMTPLTCPGDLNLSGAVTGADLGILLGEWGTPGGSTGADLNGDGTVSGADLGLLLGGWGGCPATIWAVSPSQGCTLGGTEVTIRGAGLGSVASVTVGGVPCSGVTVDSPTTVRATIPAGVPGAADVAVTTLGGTTVSAPAFTYREMVVSTISPNIYGGTGGPAYGGPAGGEQVIVTGECLGNVTAVSIGGSPALAVKVVDASTVTAITPPGPLGAADVVVTGGKGSVTVPGGFIYFSAPSWATSLQEQPDSFVVTDPALRAAIIATGRPWRVVDTATQIEMLLVPPGTFQMGCIMGSNQTGCFSWEQPVHTVTLTQPFYLGRYEVTQRQWTARMGSNPSYFQTPTAQVSASWVPLRPVEGVSWNAVSGFCSNTGMRLPTEAEWEYACRAGTETPFYNGSTDEGTVGSLAWYWSNAGSQTRPVGWKIANALGFYDMLGNVWEWVFDGYGAYPSGAQTDPTGPVGAVNRVIRGGAWTYEAVGVRSSFRFKDGKPPGYGAYSIGFRVARTP